jgi:DNA-binding IscR family transcriptional regulator
MDTCDIFTICPTHDFWARIRREITEELRTTTLASVIASKRGFLRTQHRLPLEDRTAICGQGSMPENPKPELRV